MAMLNLCTSTDFTWIGLTEICQHCHNLQKPVDGKAQVLGRGIHGVMGQDIRLQELDLSSHQGVTDECLKRITKHSPMLGR